jgi:hypothetical protein
LFGEVCCDPVLGRVVGHAVDPAAPDHADPRAGEDAHACGWSSPAARVLLVDLRGPGLACRLLSAKIVMALRKRLPLAQRKCTARCLPDSLVTGGAAGEGGDGVRMLIGLAAAAPLGETWAALIRPDLGSDVKIPVRVLPEVGGHRSVEVLDRVDARPPRVVQATGR